MAKLRVKIDDAPLHTGHAVRGMGFYTRNLIESLKNNKEVEINDKNYDIVHYPYFDLFSNTLKPEQTKKVVVTIADVIPLLYPNIYKSGVKGKLNFIKQKRALSKIDAIVTISETSKKDIVRLLDVPEEKVFVSYLGPGNTLRKTSKKMKLPKKFVLYVGDINWNKNLNNFIKALNKASLNGVIVGKNAQELLEEPEKFDFSHPQIKHLEELHNLLKESNNINVLGYLEDDEFAAVYKQATVYCQPSFYEGFGLPLLEAMQYDVPVVAAKTQALVEVGGEAAMYVDPYSQDEISDGLMKVMNYSAIRKKLMDNGRKRLKEFSWEKAATETISVYKSL